MKPAALWARWVALFEEEDEAAPRYDPVHLAVVLVACVASLGVLFWLMWTLLVYEGGLGTKASALAEIALGGKTLADFGWSGAPDRQGVFEGWLANLAALAISALVLAGLHRLDRRRAR